MHPILFFQMNSTETFYFTFFLNQNKGVDRLLNFLIDSSVPDPRRNNKNNKTHS